MEVEVVSEIEIARSRAEVAVYASDPDNATSWYRNIKRVEWATPKPQQIGSKLDFIAQFLGRTIAYTYEVKEITPGERFVMATSEGPFAMETTYIWRDTAGGGTKMTLRKPRSTFGLWEGGGADDDERDAPCKRQGSGPPERDPRILRSFRREEGGLTGLFAPSARPTRHRRGIT